METKKVPFSYKNKILQIYEDDKPLTQIQVARIMSNLKDRQIRETANESLRGNSSVPLYCDNPKHDLYKKCVGGGVCLAKKYKRLDVSVDQVCQGCRSTVIIQTLNYIFDAYFNGKYRAEWRTSRRSIKPIKEKKVRIKRNREDIEEILQSMPTQNGAIPKRGRRKGSKNKPKVTVEEAPSKKVIASKPKKTKDQKEIIPVGLPVKKGRGRPAGSKNKPKGDGETVVKTIEPEPVQKKPRGRPRTKLPLVAAAA